MNTRNNRQTDAQTLRRETRLLIVLALATMSMALFGILLVSYGVLLAVRPVGSIYPHSLLSRLSADYQQWQSTSQPLLPPINPIVVAAAERDANAPISTDDQIIPPAFLIKSPVAKPPLSSVTPAIPAPATETFTAPSPTASATPTTLLIPTLPTEIIPSATSMIVPSAPDDQPTATITPVPVNHTPAIAASTPIVTKTATQAATITATRQTATNTAIPTATAMPTATATPIIPTMAPVAPVVPATPTATPTLPISIIVTVTPTNTASPTATSTPTSAITITPTATPTATSTPTSTVIPTATSTLTPTASPTATSTPTLNQCNVTVTNTYDAGVGSLRQAILDANTCTSSSTITFNIPGSGPYSIDLSSELPTLTNSMIIDGWSQPGWVGQPLIELNGRHAGWAANGLRINANNSSVRGLILNRFNRYGIVVSGEGSTIQGNYIGTDSTGMLIAANNLDGLLIETANNLIGGTTVEAGNLISGNDQHGISIVGHAASGNTIQGNVIGLNAARTAALGNRQEGIAVWFGAHNNLIGGIVPGAGNIITGNDQAGVAIIAWGPGTNRNALLGNTIYANSIRVPQPEIELNWDGITSNNGTFDTYQANDGIDHPVLTSASLSGSNLTVTGYVGSAPDQQIFAHVRVEIFKSNNGGSGHGGGQVYLGFLMTDSDGNFSGTIITTHVTAGDTLTSTATDTDGNTSEFGPDSASLLLLPTSQ